MPGRWFLAITAVSLTTFALEAQVTSDRLLHAAQEPQNWLTYSGGYQSQRHSPLKQIDPTNAKNLEQKWVYQVDSSLQNFARHRWWPLGSCTSLSRSTTWDAKTGRAFWIYRHNLPNDIKPCCGSVSRGVAIWGDLVFLGTLDGRLIWMRKTVGRCGP